MDPFDIRKLLCPVDYSEYGQYGLDYALGLAGRLDAELRLLHVVDAPLMPASAEHGMASLGTPIDEMEDLARQEMQKLVEACRPKHAQVDGLVSVGVPFVEIIRLARQWPAELIVMGTHGRTGLSHMLIGSVAEKVVRKSPCPVLTARHPHHAFEMP